MRASVAALLLLSASVIPLAAHADTVDVMTVTTGNGHTYVFDFPTLETFTYQNGLPLFVPVLTPLSETIDGTSVTPTGIAFHPDSNIIGPFGTILYLNVLIVLSNTGPFTNPVTMQSYDVYTSTFLTGSFDGFPGITSGSMGEIQTTFDVSIQQESVTATPEPSSLFLMTTAFIGITATALLRRFNAGTPAST